MAAVDTIEVLDNLLFAHLNTADIYTVDAAGVAGESVKTHSIVLPTDVFAARVIINNAYGATGSTIYARVIATKKSVGSGPTKIQGTKPLDWTSVAIANCKQSGEISLSLEPSQLFFMLISQ